MMIEPFAIAVPQAELDDLRVRLVRTRWPDPGAGGWRDGTDLAYLREVVDYWRDTYDWRRAEVRLNAFPQVRVDCGGIRIHALHVRGTGPAPLPLVMTHGWPGSFVEMLAIAPRLTEPAAYGADPADAFDLVIPSLPGYGFSDRPRSGGTAPRTIARMWLELMSALGYERFGAQGGDWGSAVSLELAIAAPDRLVSRSGSRRSRKSSGLHRANCSNASCVLIATSRCRAAATSPQWSNPISLLRRSVPSFGPTGDRRSCYAHRRTLRPMPSRAPRRRRGRWLRTAFPSFASKMHPKGYDTQGNSRGFGPGYDVTTMRAVTMRLSCDSRAKYSASAMKAFGV